MNCYVLGAGVSIEVGYPPGSDVFEAIATHVGGCAECQGRECRGKGWASTVEWLRKTRNPLIRLVWNKGNCRDIEYLFTVLDLANEQRLAPAHAVFDRKSQAGWPTPKELNDYAGYREVLVEALGHYFLCRHVEDLQNSKDPKWVALRKLANVLKKDDVVITFNYDAAVERVLHREGKWSVEDGYGFRVCIQNPNGISAPSPKGASDVKVLHLHGATGWYRAELSPDFKISLDTHLLTGLGMSGEDEHKAALPPNRQLMLHPSYLKDYEDATSGNAFIGLWQQAAENLRKAEHVYIIGYSLPKADVAALTLLLTNCKPGTVTTVNRCSYDRNRLGDLFHEETRLNRKEFELLDWLNRGCPDRT